MAGSRGHQSRADGSENTVVISGRIGTDAFNDTVEHHVAFSGRIGVSVVGISGGNYLANQEVQVSVTIAGAMFCNWEIDRKYRVRRCDAKDGWRRTATTTIVSVQQQFDG